VESSSLMETEYFKDSSSSSSRGEEEPARHHQQQEQNNNNAVAMDRGKEVIWIIVTEVVAPLLQSWWKMGGRIPVTVDDWEEFWSFRSPSGSSGKWSDAAEPPSNNNNNNNNAQRVCIALERLGPTFVKFGQAISTRPDIIPTTLATALLRLTDRMEPFDTAVAKSIIRQELLLLPASGAASVSSSSSSSSSSVVLSPVQIEEFIKNLSPEPVAAASIGQVYSGLLDMAATGKDTTGCSTRMMKVAVKVKRPGIRDTVLSDAAFLRLGARWIDQLAFPFARGSGRSGSSGSGTGTTITTITTTGTVIATRLENAVDEFMTRILEELDYTREAANVQTFARLYSHRRHENNSNSGGIKRSYTKSSSNINIQVVVPELIPELCTQEILVMEWLHGTKFDAPPPVPVLPDDILVDDNDALATVAEREQQLEQRKRAISETVEQDLKL
jgi:ABC1 atypical kinase-like domain